jgi:hypothetical protein
MKAALRLVGGLLLMLTAIGCRSVSLPSLPSPSAPPALPVAAQPFPPGDAEKVKDLVIDRPGTPVSVTLWRSDQQVFLRAATGETLALAQPYGKYVTATLDVIPSPAGEHMLVTVRRTFDPKAWVLALEQDGFHVAFTTDADHDIGVAGDAVRTRSRQYVLPGGYWLLSRDYRVNQATGLYELAATSGAPVRVDLRQGTAGIYQAIGALPDIVDYRSRLKDVGYRLVFRPSESPSWWVVAVGEDQPQKVTITSWYVVRKADGMLLQWDLREAPPDN